MNDNVFALNCDILMHADREIGHHFLSQKCPPIKVIDFLNLNCFKQFFDGLKNVEGNI